MKITLVNESGLILIYLYFFSREQCIQLNNGGETDLSCRLLFDSEDEWLGIKLATNNIIEDHLEPNNSVTISQSKGTWTILFRSDKAIAREEIQDCITDLYDNKYTGIELVVPKGTIPKYNYINKLIYNSK